MKLSACMIVKNEEKMLAKTLPSLSKYADEIVLMDTGSSDGTMEVAKKFGAKIYRFPWINDFSAARNESLKYATGDWILWIDADEFMTEEDLKTLKDLLEISADGSRAFSLTLYESKLDACEKKNGYQRVKIFKNKRGCRFVRPINEQLVDGEGNVVEARSIPVAIYHWGKNLEEIRMAEKREKYVKLYSQALEASPDDPYLHFLLANNLNDLRSLLEALEHYDRAYELAPDKEIGRQALEKKADLLLRLKKLPESARAAQKLLEIDEQNIPARNVFASLYLIAGKIDTAIDILFEALQIKVDGGRIGNLYHSQAMPYFLLGKAYEIKGEKEKAEDYFDRAKEICPELFGSK